MKIFKRKAPAEPPQRAELNASMISLRDKLTEALSGLGGVTDRVSRVRYEPPQPVGQSEIEAAFIYDGLIERWVVRLVEDALAKGIAFPSLDADENKAIQDFLESPRVDFWGNVERAWITMRQNHGAAIWMDTGATDPTLPLQDTEQLRRMIVLDSEQLWGVDVTEFTEPELWMTGTSDVPQRIHRSRLLLFPGRFISGSYRKEKLGWGAREIDRIWEAWLHFKITYLMPANIAMTFEEGVISLEGLNNQLTSEQGRNVVRSKLLDLEGIRSFLRLRVQDSKDKFERQGPPVTGLADIMDVAKKYFVTVTGWPHTVLLGESPGAGLDGAGAGKSQKEEWQRIVLAEQERYLRPVIRQFLAFIAPSLRRQSRLALADLTFVFPSIITESDAERADRQLVEAQRDKIYIEALAVDPEEMREDLTRREVYNLDLTMERPEYEATTGD